VGFWEVRSFDDGICSVVISVISQAMASASSADVAPLSDDDEGGDFGGEGVRMAAAVVVVEVEQFSSTVTYRFISFSGRENDSISGDSHRSSQSSVLVEDWVSVVLSLRLLWPLGMISSNLGSMRLLCFVCSFIGGGGGGGESLSFIGGSQSSLNSSVLPIMGIRTLILYLL